MPPSCCSCHVPTKRGGGGGEPFRRFSHPPPLLTPCLREEDSLWAHTLYLHHTRTTQPVDAHMHIRKGRTVTDYNIKCRQGAPGSPAAFSGLCKKCRQIPILIIPLSPHFFHFSHSALRGRAGTRDWPSDGAGARLGARWLFRPLCRKCRQPAILILLVSPHLFHSAAGAQWGRAGVGEGVAPPTSRGQSGQAMAESRAGSEVPNQPRCGSIESRHTRRELGESGAQRGARRGVRGDALGL